MFFKQIWIFLFPNEEKHLLSEQVDISVLQNTEPLRCLMWNMETQTPQKTAFSIECHSLKSKDKRDINTTEKKNCIVFSSQTFVEFC